MPNLRRLAYRDRYVWLLTQTSTGGESDLPPIAFANDTPTDVLLSLTGNEFNTVLSALLTGADLSYPEKSHEVVWTFLKWFEFPVLASSTMRQDIFARLATPFGGTLVIQKSATWTFNYYATVSVNTAGTMLTDTVYLTKGDWQYSGIYPKLGDGGITFVSLYRGGVYTEVFASGVDQYAATTAEFTVNGSVTVPATGFYELRVRNNSTKNAASPAYRVAWILNTFYRTS